MESYKEAFIKFSERFSSDISNLQEKSLKDIREIKSIYQTVSEIESKIINN